MRHGHYGKGPGPAHAPLPPPGKPLALGARGGLRALLGTPAAAGRKFLLRRKHRLRLAAVRHWCLTGLALPEVVRETIFTVLGGVTQYVAPFIAEDSDTARHLAHITVQVAKDRSRYAFDDCRDSLQDDRTLGLT